MINVTVEPSGVIGRRVERFLNFRGKKRFPNVAFGVDGIRAKKIVRVLHGKRSPGVVTQKVARIWMCPFESESGKTETQSGGETGVGGGW